MIDTPPFGQIILFIWGFFYLDYSENCCTFAASNSQNKKTFNMELIKKIQNAVQNNGGEINLSKEKVVIQWLGVVSFEIHSLNSSGGGRRNRGWLLL